MSGKLKEVRNRIGSVKSTKQITLAMKLVSASKLRKAQEGIINMRPYAMRLQNMLKNLAIATEGDVAIDQAEEREVQKVMIVCITSDRGLCGGYNSNIIKRTNATIAEYGAQKKLGNLKVMCIGKKGYDVFRKEEIDLDDKHVELFADLNFESTADVSERLMEEFGNGDYDKVLVVYSRFKNAATQEFEVDQFLPIAKIETGGDEEKAKELNSDYIFEPNKVELIQQLVPKILKTQFYRYLLDAHASEHGARMTAMDKATENADELLKDLKITYNRARQAAITTELTEIVSGAAALQEG